MSLENCQTFQELADLKAEKPSSFKAHKLIKDRLLDLYQDEKRKQLYNKYMEKDIEVIKKILKSVYSAKVFKNEDNNQEIKDIVLYLTKKYFDIVVIRNISAVKIWDILRLNTDNFKEYIKRYCEELNIDINEIKRSENGLYIFFNPTNEFKETKKETTVYGKCRIVGLKFKEYPYKSYKYKDNYYKCVSICFPKGKNKNHILYSACKYNVNSLIFETLYPKLLIEPEDDETEQSNKCADNDTVNEIYSHIEEYSFDAQEYREYIMNSPQQKDLEELLEEINA